MPKNNICSKRWAVPRKGSSSREQPTFTSNETALLSDSASSIKIHRMLFGSVRKQYFMLSFLDLMKGSCTLMCGETELNIVSE